MPWKLGVARGPMRWPNPAAVRRRRSDSGRGPNPSREEFIFPASEFQTSEYFKEGVALLTFYEAGLGLGLKKKTKNNKQPPKIGAGDRYIRFVFQVIID